MHGKGICPLGRYIYQCRKRGQPESPTESKQDPCEWWDEYEQECAINLLVRYIRKLEGEKR